MTNQAAQILSQGPSRQNAHLTFKGNIRNGRHGWLRLTPAYSLHVVNDILQNAGPHELVLDPFSGTGTTPLAGSVFGLRAHSVDLNPFLVWLGNLKLRSYPATTSHELGAVAKRMVLALRRRKRWNDAWIPKLHQIEKWWDAPIVETLANVYASIELKEVSPDKSFLIDLLKIAFCRCAIETSHASFSHQSMSFKKRRVHQGQLFEPDPLAEPREWVFAKFLVSVDAIAKSLSIEQPTGDAAVYLGDSRDLEACLPTTGYTKVITSPPYPNRMSYIRELRPYMYWLSFLSDGRQAGELDWQAIGGTWGCATSNLNTWDANGADVPFPRFDKLVQAIGQDHKLLGRYVHKYFVDMMRHIASLKEVMAPGGQCYYIVGNSKFYGTLLPVERIYAALFEDAGFRRTRIETLRKRNSKKELFEYLVYAEAPA